MDQRKESKNKLSLKQLVCMALVAMILLGVVPLAAFAEDDVPGETTVTEATKVADDGNDVAHLAEENGNIVIQPDKPFIRVKKVIAGISADKIPAEFYENFVVKVNDSSNKMSNGTVADWELYNLDAGTYTISEAGAQIDGYDLSVSVSGVEYTLAEGQTITDLMLGSGVQVSLKAADALVSEIDPGTSQGGGTTYDVVPGTIFVGHNSGGGDVILISHSPIDLGLRQVLETKLKALNGWSSNPKFTYYNLSQYKAGDHLTAGTVSFTYNGNSITFDGQNNYNKYAKTILTITEAENASITITNTYTPKVGNLKITKNISGVTSTEATSYNFIVTPDEGVSTAALTSWAGSNGFTYADGVISGSVTVPAGNTTASVTVEKLPIGTYSVAEITTDSDGNTNMENIGNYKWIGVQYSAESVTVSRNVTVEVVATNTYAAIVGDLTISKAVNGMAGVDEDYSFTVTPGDDVDKTALDAWGAQEGNSLEVTLKAGESIKLTGLPVGTYTVTEASPENPEYYTYVGTTFSVNDSDAVVGLAATANVVDNGNTTVAYTNTYARKLASVTISKTVTGNMGDVNKKFSFAASIFDPVAGSTNTVVFELAHGGEQVIFNPMRTILKRSAKTFGNWKNSCAPCHWKTTMRCLSYVVTCAASING